MKYKLKIAIAATVFLLFASSSSFIGHSNLTTHQQNNNSAIIENTLVAEKFPSIDFISSPLSHSFFAIARDSINGDRLYGWGNNQTYILGLDHNEDVNTPTQININGLKPRDRITSVTANESMAVVVVNNLDIYMSGLFVHLPVTGETSYTAKKFEKVEFSWTEKINQIIVGDRHILILTDLKKVYSWGRNDFGQLGLGNTNNYNVPQAIKALEDQNIQQIGTTDITSWAQVNNAIYLWGYGGDGMMGDGTNVSDVTIPRKLTLSVTPSQVMSSSKSIYVNLNGDIWGWGANQFGELNLGNANVVNIPTKTNSTGSEEIIAAGGNFFITLKDGNFYSVGENDKGQLGIGNLGNSPTKIIILDGSNENTKVLTINKSVLAITENGLKAWGSNESGQYGNDTATSTDIPDYTSPKEVISFGEVSQLISRNNGNIRASEALINFYKYDQLNLDGLNEYVSGLNTFPEITSAVLKSIPSVNDINGTIDFTIETSKLFSAPDGALKTGKTDYRFTIRNFKVDAQANNWWIYLVAACGAMVGIGLIIYVIIIYKKKKSS